MYEFSFRTGKVTIDHDKCTDCSTYACVKACSLYDRGILRLLERKPVLRVSSDEAQRLCSECLACELNCRFNGRKAITISLPIPGLREFRKKVGLR